MMEGPLSWGLTPLQFLPWLGHELIAVIAWCTFWASRSQRARTLQVPILDPISRTSASFTCQPIRCYPNPRHWNVKRARFKSNIVNLWPDFKCGGFEVLNFCGPKKSWSNYSPLKSYASLSELEFKWLFSSLPLSFTHRFPPHYLP